jgi:uncharacterized membrane protein YdjX (TVP38/TMEM64 family)
LLVDPADTSPLLHRSRNRLLLAAGLVLGCAAVGFAAWRFGVLPALTAFIAGLREAGPLLFFVAMAVLPAVGFPLIAFTLTAGPVFAPLLGTGWVITWSLCAVVANLLLTHWLTNRLLRPVAGRLLGYVNFHLPVDAAGDAWHVTLIVRLTPGPPFWAQSYLLGLMRVPLVPYLVVSTLVMAGYIVALVCGGAAVASGNGRLGFLALGVLLVAVTIRQLLRRRAARQRTAAALLVSAARAVPVE